MPRAPSEKIHEAKKLFDKGVAMVEIAKKLDISAGTIRSWKNRYGWGESQKKNKRNVAKKMRKQMQRCNQKSAVHPMVIKLPEYQETFNAYSALGGNGRRKAEHDYIDRLKAVPPAEGKEVTQA